MANNGNNSGIVPAIDTAEQLSAASNPTVTAAPQQTTVSEQLEYAYTMSGSYGDKVSIPLSFTGTPEDVERAYEIAAAGIGRILNQQRIISVDLIHPNMASDQGKKNIAYMKQTLGDNVTQQMWMQYVAANQPAIVKLRNMTSAKEVIEKYGEKAGKDPEFVKNISSPTVDKIRKARAAATAAKAAQKQSFIAQHGYWKDGTTVDVVNKLPSDLAGVKKITGKTYQHKDEIKAAGFKWNGSEWYKP